jgi:hypothetical protein
MFVLVLAIAAEAAPPENDHLAVPDSQSSRCHQAQPWAAWSPAWVASSRDNEYLRLRLNDVDGSVVVDVQFTAVLGGATVRWVRPAERDMEGGVWVDPRIPEGAAFGGLASAEIASVRSEVRVESAADGGIWTFAAPVLGLLWVNGAPLTWSVDDSLGEVPPEIAHRAESMRPLGAVVAPRLNAPPSWDESELTRGDEE